MRVYLGFDLREYEAVLVAQRTLSKVSGLDYEMLNARKLAAQGLLYRPVLETGNNRYDIVSNAAMSTEFSISRFLTPLLCQSTWALYADCDVVFYEDPRHMLAEIEGDCAVYVVKHDYTPSGTTKMDGQDQSRYQRKNWSSVMLFNCEHPANKRLTLRDVNSRTGRELHQFYWLSDDEIGSLDGRWNWLVGEQERAPQDIGRGIAHFTLGGPWLNDRDQSGPYDQSWLAAAESTGVRK